METIVTEIIEILKSNSDIIEREKQLHAYVGQVACQSASSRRSSTLTMRCGKNTGRKVPARSAGTCGRWSRSMAR